MCPQGSAMHCLNADGPIKLCSRGPAQISPNCS